jgi:hypothetical protein
MQNSELNYPSTSDYKKENGNDLLRDFLEYYALTEISYEEQQDSTLDEFSQGISKLNEILENLTLPEPVTFMDEWITQDIVLQKLGISERTLASWRKSGKLPYSPIEHKFFYKKQDIEDLLWKSFKKNERT